MGNITISAANLPEGTCPPWIIPLWPILVSNLSANLNGALNVFNYESSTPAPADQGKPWIRMDAAGRIDKVFNYSGGAWIAKHPVAPGFIQLWEGDITTVDTLDGGEAAAVTATTGPMWERVTQLNGRFPLGGGAQITSSTIINPGDTGGEETHVLTVAELAAHHHNVQVVSANIESGSESTRLRSEAATTQPEAVTDDTGAGVAHNNMPPWYGVWFLRRTARTHYRI